MQEGVQPRGVTMVTAAVIFAAAFIGMAANARAFRTVTA